MARLGPGSTKHFGGTFWRDAINAQAASESGSCDRGVASPSGRRDAGTTHSDFRFIAATNRDLHADMMSGTFREDLFHRLAVINLSLPPLRERPEDIRWLTERMLQQLTVEQGRPIAVSEAFMCDVLGRTWKGNARELRSYLEQAAVLSEGILDVSPPATRTDRLDPDSGPFVPLQAMVEETERVHIQRALSRAAGSVSKTADLLGISRKTLWEKMKRLGISGTTKEPTSATVN